MTRHLDPPLTWPSDRFYWAVLDASGWSGHGELPPGLLPTLADELPIELESVHAVATQINSGRILVCACPREHLQRIELKATALVPESVPEALNIPDGPATASTLNLLVGEFEPTPIRAARRSRHLFAAATCMLCVVLMGVGLIRRTHHSTLAARSAAAASDALLKEHTADRREQTLAAEVQLMRSIADSARRAKPPAEAALVFESFLSAWPTQPPSKTQSVTAGPDGVSVGVIVEGDPAPFLAALKPPATLALDEPRVNTVGGTTRLSLHLRPAKPTANTGSTTSRPATGKEAGQ